MSFADTVWCILFTLTVPMPTGLRFRGRGIGPSFPKAVALRCLSSTHGLSAAGGRSLEVLGTGMDPPKPQLLFIHSTSRAIPGPFWEVQGRAIHLPALLCRPGTRQVSGEHSKGFSARSA